MTRGTSITFLIPILLCTLFADDAHAHPGWGVVVDRHGQVYFGDVTSNTIWKITAEGRLVSVARNKHLHELSLDEEGNLYGEHVYCAVSASGRRLRRTRRAGV